jgi:hypothetical protein
MKALICKFSLSNSFECLFHTYSQIQMPEMYDICLWSIGIIHQKIMIYFPPFFVFRFLRKSIMDHKQISYISGICIWEYVWNRHSNELLKLNLHINAFIKMLCTLFWINLLFFFLLLKNSFKILRVARG